MILICIQQHSYKNRKWPTMRCEKTMRTVNTSSLGLITTSYVSKWDKLLELEVDSSPKVVTKFLTINIETIATIMLTTV